MNKTFKSYVAIWAIILVVFNAITFLIPKNYDVNFGVSYAFITLAFIAQLGTAFFTFKQENLNKFFLNISTINISYITLVCVVIFGSICMVIPNMPAIVTAIFSLLIIAIGAITIIKAKTGADIVSTIDDKVKSKVSFIKLLQADVELLAEEEKDADVKALLQKLAEEIRFSDPISDDSLSNLETEISSKINAIKYSDKKAELINNIILLLSERNKKAKILK